MNDLPIYQLDAFTDRLFAGNPAAVCPLPGGWLPAEKMQAIAAENNLAETAFLMRKGDAWAIRWFTPTVEVALCGHATLASGAVVLEDLAPELDSVSFASASGPLSVSRDDGCFSLDFPSRPPAIVDAAAAVSAAIGGVEVLETRRVLPKGKMLARLTDAAAVAAVRPDLAAIRDLPGDGLIITAEGGPAGVVQDGIDTPDFVSRYFAPHAGIDEDPVTGSAHVVLAPYWAEKLGKTSFAARQISQRGGLLKLSLEGERVKITGQVARYLEGRIKIEG